ncbi:hypothetical protein EOD39_15903 [Acipenser ruthenus]|uniref:Chromodomain-helicase-DNA-binding protein 1-like C-terminal domain-containing protein n=1 Tax=Acipenser ruthenus TaxID=7906 RepID=A0A444V748_ACIRT|nr:hypothetical protein EOD39_15903 [Acipenser ruthenus]
MPRETCLVTVDFDSKRAAVRKRKGSAEIVTRKCKESMRPVKKALKQLELLKDLPLEQQVRSTRTQVLTIGEHVSTCLAEYTTAQEARYWKRYLWKFASIFSEHNARTLRRLYKYSQVNQEDKFMKTYWGTGFPGPAQVQSLECKQLYNAWGLPVDSSSSDLGRGQSAVEDQHLTDRHTDGSLPGSKKEDPTQSDESQQDSPYSSSAVRPAQKSWPFPDPHDLKNLKIPRMFCGKEPHPSSASLMYKSPLQAVSDSPTQGSPGRVSSL